MIEEFDAVRAARSSGILESPPPIVTLKTLTLPLFHHHLAHAACEVSYSFPLRKTRYLNCQSVPSPSILFGIEIRRSPMQVPFANELESDEELLAPEEAEAPISPVTAAITRHAR